MVKHVRHARRSTFEDPAALDRCFAALADPTRRSIVQTLAGGQATLGDLAAPLPMSLPAVHKHVRVLEEAGLVTTTKRGRSRHVRLRGIPMKEAVDWMRRYETFWNERLDRLGDLLEELETEMPKE